MPPLPIHDSSRRRFIQQAGVGLASLAALRTFAASGENKIERRLRLGLIGCGNRGQWLLDLMKEHGGFEVAGAADYFGDRVREVADKFGLSRERTFTGLSCAEKMIAGGGLDAVAIISPPYFHPTQARAAVDAGLHVFLAKPVAVDVPGCHSIAESEAIARRKGRVFLVDFQTRTDPFYREAVRRVHDGALGEVCFGEAAYHSGRIDIKVPPASAETRLRNWVFDQVLSGDIIVEQNIHSLDVMNWLMRDTSPVRCTGTGGRRVRVDVGDTWDHFALLFEYPNDVGVTFSSRQFDAHGETDAILNKLYGSKGVFQSKYGGDVMIRGGRESFYRGGATTSIYRDGAMANLRNFFDAVMKNDASNPTVAASVTSTLVAIMGRTAAHERRTVTWKEVVANKDALRFDSTGLAV